MRYLYIDELREYYQIDSEPKQEEIESVDRGLTIIRCIGGKFEELHFDGVWREVPSR